MSKKQPAQFQKTNFKILLINQIVLNTSKAMTEDQTKFHNVNTIKADGLLNQNQYQARNCLIDKRPSRIQLLPQLNNSIHRRASAFITPQELLLNKQAKKLFDIGQGGISLPGLSYISTKIHSPSQRMESSKIIAQKISSQKPLNESSQEFLNKQFPFFEVTNVKELDNKIDFFSQHEAERGLKSDQEKQKNMMKINFSNKRKRDSIVLDLIQLQNKNTFVQPQFMQERGTMCITELWPESMKKELVKSHQFSQKKIQNAQNLRLNNSDKSFMSVFRPEKQRQQVDIQQNQRDENSQMVLSKFSEKNVIEVFGLMNENRNNKILLKQRSFTQNQSLQSPKSRQQTAIQEDDEIHENTSSHSFYGRQVQQTNPKNKFIFSSTPKFNNKSTNFEINKSSSKLNSKVNLANSKFFTSTPKKHNYSNYSNLSQFKNIQNIDLNYNNNSMQQQQKQHQDILESNNKFDFLKSQCEQELEHNLDLEKSINSNLKDISTKLQGLLQKLK
ncbi:hypothetical protein TTHERM_00239270 (macronuclear) [Tetrahymena thermophila SB210]|uniref:Uncharacterized protein n=1 Tax=Tetrahymena thermophila (strain SB210) TaxID=312017 RepID=I7M3Z6_TETTS|nr:hypothetical protein TTHERM_00239270 [Tetrahymena thermophila SB210]EAS04606.2 hypothetical protein TTHERM_00239270 [Tetrahymena thermophila SB210]|eukprot:XP_001024851.2 hypothetical protein TTHERM_00239270 [Tetrahymena thermophila SB210]